MSLLNPAILYGLAFAAIPIAIHLMMKAKPKKLVFPALRLIQQRRQKNTRRLRLRHFWLLALRMLILALLVLAITRPALSAADYGLNLREALSLLAIGAGCVALYYFLMKRWRKARLPNHELLSRRSYLRGGTGVLGALLFALLVAWPYQTRVAAEITAPLPDVSPDLPVAAVFLFDTSLSMDYQEDNETRLAVAQEIAKEHLTNLPSRSRVAVADTSASSPILFQADMIGATTQIEALEAASTAFALNDRLRSALALQEEDRKRTLASQGSVAVEARADQLVREVYIFTDMAASGWNPSSAKFLRDELERLEWVGVYLIDISVDEPRNIAITNLRLSRETVSQDGMVELSADIESLGYDNKKVTLEFSFKNDKGELVKRAQREVLLKNEAAPRVSFMAKGLKQAVTQGEIRMVSTDPLTSDNALMFSIGVKEQLKVAVIAEAPSASKRSIERSDAGILVVALEALSFGVTFIPANKLAEQPLNTFDVVCMVNVARPAEEDWEILEEFARAGGGLAIFLGSYEVGEVKGIRATNYEGDIANKFLPASLRGAVGMKNSLDVKDTTHPVLQKFAIPGAAAELAMIPVRRRWNVSLNDGASVIVRYTDDEGNPALIERPYQDGRTIMMTTAINQHSKANRSWNALTSGLDGHYFFILVDQLVNYLSRRNAARLNYLSGDEVLIELDRGIELKRFFLRKPSGVQLPGDIAPNTTSIRISNADELGHFGVVSADEGVEFETGFSVNPPAGESNLTKLNTLDLDQLIGPDRYAVANNIESLSRKVTAGRLGVEVFPIILAIAIAVFCLELTVANRFYEADQDSKLATQT